MAMFPAARYHASGAWTVVPDADHDLAGEGWADTPAAFDLEVVTGHPLSLSAAMALTLASSSPSSSPSPSEALPPVPVKRRPGRPRKG